MKQQDLQYGGSIDSVGAVIWKIPCSAADKAFSIAIVNSDKVRILSETPWEGLLADQNLSTVQAEGEDCELLETSGI